MSAAVTATARFEESKLLFENGALVADVRARAKSVANELTTADALGEQLAKMDINKERLSEEEKKYSNSDSDDDVDMIYLQDLESGNQSRASCTSLIRHVAGNSGTSFLP